MSLFTKELRDLRYRLIILTVFILAMGVFVLGTYELFIQSIDINQITAALDNPSLNKFLNPETLTKQLTALVNNIDLYVWSQWFGKNFMQLILLASILLGFSAFARETEHNTNSFLLTNFSRSQVFATKIYAGILSMTILVGIGCFLPVAVAAFKSFDFNLIESLKYLVQILPGALLCYAIIIFFSVLSTDVVKPIILGIITFALLSVPGRIDSLKGVYVYRYLAGTDVFFNGHINLLAVIIISLITLLIFLAAHRLYRGKNF